MTLAVLLLTGCALFAAIAVVSAMLARQWAADALHSERRLLRQRGDIVALETAVEAFDKKLRVINGRMSAAKRWEQPEPPQTSEVCPNWRTSQYPEGDDCQYCIAMRAEREAALAHARSGSATLGALAQRR